MSSISTRDSAGTPACAQPQRRFDRLKRWGVRLFFASFLVVLFVDTAPGVLWGVPQAKGLLWPLLNRAGLWQGQWTLFAPNPKINNAWLSAEIYRPDGSQQEFWNSTYWAETSGWERFLRFRHINYNNRMQTQGKEVADNLADYLARELIAPTARPVVAGDSASPTSTTADAPVSGGGPTLTNSAHPWRLVLSRNELNICLPDDGTLPTRDETLWLSSSQNLTVREYQP